MRLIDVGAIWHPRHWDLVSAVAKVGTAAGSLLAALLLLVLVPKVLRLRSPYQLDLELQKLGAIVASSDHPIIRKDLDGTIESWNHAAELLYGYSEAEAVGKNISILVPPGRDDELPSILQTIKAGGRIAHYETRRITKDGRLVDVSLSVSAIYESGEVVGAATMVRDIGERLQLVATALRYTKRLELIYQMDYKILHREPLRHCAKLVIRFMDSLTAFSRIAVTVARFNSGEFDEVFGYSEGEFSEMRTNSWEPYTAFTEILRRGAIHVSDMSSDDEIPELALFRRSGAKFICHVPMLDHEELLGCLHLGASSREFFTEEILDHAREITTRLALGIQQERLWKQIDHHAAELERRVAERTKELTEANAALETFSYSVSHDLRAPLRTMQGFTEALLTDHTAQLDPVGQDYARRIAQGAHRLDRLIEDLLRYSRLSQGEITLQAVDLSAIVREVLPDLSADFEAQGTEVRIEEPLPPVLGHPATLSQVMANLLSNAAKFASPDKKSEVRVRAEDSTNGTVRIWIEDNGIGIDPNHQDRIFQIFERLHTNYPGTGTGLAIVRKGVERMGGHVGVISQSGGGSRFWVELSKPAAV